MKGIVRYQVSLEIQFTLPQTTQSIISFTKNRPRCEVADEAALCRAHRDAGINPARLLLLILERNP